MKKLTAGIFTVLMGLVTVNAAEAAVASKGYVDEKVGGATTAVETLQQTVAANKLAAEKLVSDYKTENDAKVDANTAAISANTQAIEGEKTARETAVSGLDERLVEVEKFSGTGEGSVAKQIADAVAGETSAREAADADLQAGIDAINNAETGILAEAKDYTDELAGGAVATNTAAISAINNETTGILAQAKADAASKDTALETQITNAYKAADAQTLADAKTYADGLDSAQKTAFENADKAINDKIGTVPADKTVVGMIADAQTAATYDDTEVRGLISGNAEDIAENAAAIATKLTDTTAISADGKYVLTAVTVGDDTTYAWELIERATDTTLE